MANETDEIIDEVAKMYNLTTSPPDISDPDVLDGIIAGALDRCMSDLEAAERAENASMAHACEIWTW